MTVETPDRLRALLQLIEELESKVRQRDELLTAEQERSSKARKKVRQLLAKLAERDELLAEMRAALEAFQSRPEVVAPPQRPSRTAAAPVLAAAPAAEPAVVRLDSSSRNARRPSPPRASERTSLTSGDLAMRERTSIVAQLEGHLSQMRTNLADTERELRELEEKRRAKEAEWNQTSGATPSPETAQVHWQALGLIGQQVQEKRRFSGELTRKTKELENQVAQQRRLTEEMLRFRASCPNQTVARAEYEAGEQADEGEDTEEAEGAEEAPRAAIAAAPWALGLDETLRAFLAAAGSSGEAILAMPALHSAFEARPPELTAGAVDGCEPDLRAQVLSLFAAWVAVADHAQRSMRMSDVSLALADARELCSTLETVGAQLEEW